MSKGIQSFQFIFTGQQYFPIFFLYMIDGSYLVSLELCKKGRFSYSNSIMIEYPYKRKNKNIGQIHLICPIFLYLI